jgi:prepilin-type processing-associated H-X9-DG protein/prepilin-type N-terminal cleavage/methylation domain-containing protein
MPFTTPFEAAWVSRLVSCRRRGHSGFTIVELLVVLGIMLLLAAMLLPSLASAKQAAARTGCAARLHQILIAAQTHCMDHQGYYPLVGVIPSWLPAKLDDAYNTKYDYFQYGKTGQFVYYSRSPLPITFSLSLDLSHRNDVNNSDNSYLGPEETDSLGLIRNFLCPAQANSVDELIQLPLLYTTQFDAGGGAIAYTEAQSYIFNEAICGWADTGCTNRLHGKMSQIHQQSATMFIADGLMGAVDEYPRIPWYYGTGMSTLYNIGNATPVTVADALTGDGKAGDPENFDHLRHRGKMNIGFFDGHVETRNITVSDLSSVYLLAP